MSAEEAFREVDALRKTIDDLVAVGRAALKQAEQAELAAHQLVDFEAASWQTCSEGIALRAGKLLFEASQYRREATLNFQHADELRAAVQVELRRLREAAQASG